MNTKKRSGKNYTCAVCQKEFYRGPANVRATRDDRPKFCSIPCRNIYQVGKNNPFYGKKHTEETKKTVSNSRKGKCLGNKNALGYKHTEEAKRLIGAASLRLWDEQKDKMLDSRNRGPEHHNWKSPELRAHRKNFSPNQRKELMGSECAYCGRTANLVLDHIIPLFDGGVNSKHNVQTLCQPCNLWKLHFVDIPRFYAAKAIQGDH